MIEKQKYQQYKKTEIGYEKGKIVDSFEMPWDWQMKDTDIYVAIPNPELWDDAHGGTNVIKEANQIEYLKEHCLLELRKEQGYKVHKMDNNNYIFISPTNYIEIYSFYQGVVKSNPITFPIDVLKNIFSNYLENSRL